MFPNTAMHPLLNIKSNFHRFRHRTRSYSIIKDQLDNKVPSRKERHFHNQTHKIVQRSTNTPQKNASALTIYLCAIGFFIPIAFYARFNLGYPICKNDEFNWLFIASQLDEGVFWPVSGPLFMAIMREASQQLNMSYASVMPWLGLSGSFALVCGLCWGYCKLGIIHPWKILITLALSSYFWAPLLEARPQQWGQLLVFLGSISTWLWLQQRRGGWTLLPIMACVGFTHILSHVILLCICAALVFIDLAIKRTGNYRHFVVVLVATVSTGVYFWPAGPYAAMLVDLSQVHLKGLYLTHIALLATPLILASIACVCLFRCRGRQPAKIATDFFEKYFRVIIGILAAFCILLLIVQAYLLPAQAWLPYQGSWIKFIAFQIGNLTFAGISMIGLYGLYVGLRQRQLDLAMGWFTAWILICFAILGMATVALSFWMHDTNWFLRLINYGILFAAIPAAIGFDMLKQKFKIGTALVWCISFFASLISVVRPQSLLSC